jgi:hypothetical protein
VDQNEKDLLKKEILEELKEEVKAETKKEEVKPEPAVAPSDSKKELRKVALFASIALTFLLGVFVGAVAQSGENVEHKHVDPKCIYINVVPDQPLYAQEYQFPQGLFR